jgi:hypothetical protein
MSRVEEPEPTMLFSSMSKEVTSNQEDEEMSGQLSQQLLLLDPSLLFSSTFPLEGKELQIWGPWGTIPITTEYHATPNKSTYIVF